MAAGAGPSGGGFWRRALLAGCMRRWNSAATSVQRVAEKVRACVQEPAWQAAMLTQHVPPCAWLTAVPWRQAGMFAGTRLPMVGVVMLPHVTALE